MEYSEKLRKLADYIEAKGLDSTFSRYDYPSAHIWTESAEDFARAVRLMGEGEKGGYNGQLTFLHVAEDEDSGRQLFSVEAYVYGVCEKVVKGTKVTKVHIPAGAVQQEDGSWVVETEDVEWNCPESFLGLAEKA